MCLIRKCNWYYYYSPKPYKLTSDSHTVKQILFRIFPSLPPVSAMPQIREYPRCKGKYHSTADLLFYCCGFNQMCKYVDNFNVKRLPSPLMKWVFSAQILLAQLLVWATTITASLFCFKMISCLWRRLPKKKWHFQFGKTFELNLFRTNDLGSVIVKCRNWPNVTIDF